MKSDFFFSKEHGFLKLLILNETHFSDIYEWRTTIYEEKKYLF
jgi:hypothetical protein